MIFPMSKKEKDDLLRVKELSKGKVLLQLSDVENQELKDILELLVERDVLLPCSTNHTNLYKIDGSFEIFENWAKDRDEKARKFKQREWSIAIISAVVGACVFKFTTTTAMRQAGQFGEKIGDLQAHHSFYIKNTETCRG